MKRLLTLGVALLLASPLAAQQVPPDSVQVHVVRPGDTLWDLARQYLRDPFLWPEIFRFNRERVADPDRIYPAERLRIPGLAEAPATAVPDDVRDGRAPARTVFWASEAAAAPRPAGAEAAAEEVPVVTPGAFLQAGVLAPEAEVLPLGQLVEVVAPTVVPIRIDPMVEPYDRVLVKLARPGSVQPGDELHLFRPGRRVPPYGRIFHSTGLGRVVELDGEVATVVVEELFDAVSVGDLAVPMRDFSPSAARPLPATGLEGRILAYEMPQPLPAVYDLAYLNLGLSSGVREGDEFVAVLPPERKSWGVSPEQVVARLQVVRVTDRTSAARVVHVTHPALVEGLPVRRVGRMP